MTGYPDKQQSKFERKPYSSAFEDIKLPGLNTSIEKIWETDLQAEDIPIPWNAGENLQEDMLNTTCAIGSMATSLHISGMYEDTSYS